MERGAGGRRQRGGKEMGGTCVCGGWELGQVLLMPTRQRRSGTQATTGRKTMAGASGRSHERGAMAHGRAHAGTWARRSREGAGSTTTVGREDVPWEARFGSWNRVCCYSSSRLFFLVRSHVHGLVVSGFLLWCFLRTRPSCLWISTRSASVGSEFFFYRGFLLLAYVHLRAMYESDGGVRHRRARMGQGCPRPPCQDLMCMP